MASSYVHRLLYSSANLTLDGATTITPTGISPVFAPLNRIQIHKLGLAPTSAAVGGAAVTFVNNTCIAGTPTTQTIGTVTIPAGDQSCAKDIYKSLQPPFVMNPGDKLSLTVVEGGTAPTAAIQIEYSIFDIKLTDDANAVASA